MRSSIAFKLIFAASSFSAALCIALPTGAATSSRTCRVIFKAAVPKRDLKKQARAGYESESVAAYNELQLLLRAWPKLRSERKYLKAVDDLLRDEEMSAFAEILKETFETARDRELDYLAIGRRDPMKGLIQATADVIAENMPTYEAAERRAKGLDNANLDKTKLMEIIGVNQEDAVRGLVGLRGIDNITRESVVGEYLADAQRRGLNPQTLVGTFDSGPGKGGRGERRLFVSVDAATAELANTWFGVNRHYLAHKHDPHQGTLVMHHAGSNITYAGNHRDEARIISQVGSIVPLIVLSTSEASRTLNYFDLGNMTSSSRAKYPWSLKDQSTGRKKNYCRPGGYTSCTHWVGEMPIGDRVVDTYSFPGQFDGSASQADPRAKDQAALRTGPIGTYTHFDKPYDRTEKIGSTTRVDRLTRMVWKEGKGNEQLWQMLDAKQSLTEGEFANPGWVAYTLLGPAPMQRVPVVLIMRQDASQPLTQAEIDGLRSQISQY